VSVCQMQWTCFELTCWPSELELVLVFGQSAALKLRSCSLSSFFLLVSVVFYSFFVKKLL
jgi:hypothetical protein